MSVTTVSPVLDAALRCHPVKEMARLAAVTPRSAKRWRAHEAEPNASALLRLIARSQRVRQAIAEQLAVEWLDAEEARLRAELADVRARRERHARAHPLAAVLARAADAVAAAALGSAAHSDSDAA